MSALPAELPPSRRIALGDTLVDLDAQSIERDGTTEPLTTLEADLLSYLWARSDQVVAREELLREVWRYRPGLATRAVDHLVRRLRCKIERDDAHPVHLQSVYGQGYLLTAVREAGPAKPSEPPPCNIWPQVSSWVGREPELAQLAQSLASSRLVTIVGTAGSGKTRLAREHAAASWAQYPGGVWEISLAEVEPGQVSAAIVRVIGLRDGNGDVVEAIREKGRLLLLLDNLEHLLSITPQIAGWIARTPEARYLATSRVPLRLDGEQLLELGPLDEACALELLTQRAATVGHRATPADHLVLQRIARRLDRLPLSLELAAARLRSLSVEALEARLDRGLQVLASNRRDAPVRHLSLEAAIAWSWELLDEVSQRALEATTVFRCGFGLDALEEVLEDPDTADRVTALHEQSLLRLERSAGSVRYLPYETVRMFVAARADPIRIREWELRHAEYHARWARSLVSAWERDELPARHAALVAEIANLRVAHERLLGVQPELAASVAVALAVALSVQGPLSDAEQLLTESLATEVSFAQRCELHLYRGDARNRMTKEGCIADYEVAKTSTDGEVAARAQRGLCILRWRSGAQPLDELLVGLQSAALRAEEAGAPHLVARLLLHIGLMQAQLGRPEEYKAAAARSLQIARSLGHREATLRAATHLSHQHAKRGEYEQASAQLTPFLETASGTSALSLVFNVGVLSALAERAVEAEAYLQQGIGQAQRLGSIDELLFGLVSLANLYQQHGRLDEATAVLQRAKDHHKTIESLRAVTMLAVEGRIALEQGRLSDADAFFGRALEAGPKPWERGLLRADQGDTAWGRGDQAEAARAYQEAVAILEQIGNEADAGGIRFSWAGLLAATDLEASRARCTEALASVHKPSAPYTADLVVGLQCAQRARTEPGRATELLRRARERLDALPPSAPWRVRFLAARLRQILQ